MSVKLLSGNHAAGLAATLAARANRSGRGFCSAVYPITPQTECIEFLSAQEIEKGHVVHVESEHSAMGVCIGASASGARSFTASSSNGLAFMAENLVAASLLRLPIVVAAVNRTLGPPWSIWTDHGDTLMFRDTGWIQIYCADTQEILDSILLAFRLAEDPRVLVPVMVCFDGFILSHTVSEADVPDQRTVDALLPPLDLPHRLTLEPRIFGGLTASPRQTEVHRFQHHRAMEGVMEIYPELQEQFERILGRRPQDPVVGYRLGDADVVFVSMGSMASSVDRAVDVARDSGVRAGSLRLRILRPFPRALLRRALAGGAHIAILDRDISLGFGGVLGGEIAACAPAGSIVQTYVLGLGGGDVRPEHISALLDDLHTREDEGDPVLVEVGS